MRNVCAILLCDLGKGGLAHSGEGGGSISSEVDGFDVLQKFIPCVEQLVFVHVPVKQWIIYLDEHGFLDGPGDTTCFAVYIFHLIGKYCPSTSPGGCQITPLFPSAPVYIIHNWCHLG